MTKEEEILEITKDTNRIVKSNNKLIAGMCASVSDAKDTQDKFTPKILDAIGGMDASLRQFSKDQSRTLQEAMDKMLSAHAKSLETIVAASGFPPSFKIITWLSIAILVLVGAVVGVENLQKVVELIK
jgi:hypothetical protein